MLGKQLKLLRETMQKSQQEVCSALNIEQSTLANYENGKRIPKIEILIKIATYYKVPTDYLLGIGAFENWDMLLENKKTILYQISIQAQQLALNIREGVDDITFAKLVYAFDIRITTNEDGEIGISGKDPIPTYTQNYCSNAVDVNDDEKGILSLYRAADDDGKKNLTDLLNSFCALQERKNKIMVLGRCFELEEAESVAADSHKRKAAGN